MAAVNAKIGVQGENLSGRFQLGYPDDFLNMTSPVPPLEEQTEIATRINDENNAALKEAELLSSSISLLREYRAALISAAVTGQLNIRKHEKQLEALA